MSEFDPNKMRPSQKSNWTYEWATYIPNRSPQFKIHGTKGHATAACKDKSIYGDLHYHIPSDIKLYKKDSDGFWLEIKIVRKYPLKNSGRFDITTGEYRAD